MLLSIKDIRLMINPIVVTQIWELVLKTPFFLITMVKESSIIYKILSFIFQVNKVQA